MADGTHIEWTDATWQIVTGCSVVSPGCTNCYAMRLAGTRLRNHPSRKGLTTPSKTGPVWNGTIFFNVGWLKQPLHWKKPRDIFVAAHGDLFHNGVQRWMLVKIFTVMALARQHRFQVLTKRAENMRVFCTWLQTDEGRAEMEKAAREIGHTFEYGGQSFLNLPLPNVWLGVSAEDQPRADERIPALLATPAAVRWVSAEPLLGSLDFRHVAPTDSGYINALSSSTGPNLNWIVAGGESGPGARPVQLAWARSLRDQCAAADVPFFWKQWGAWAPMSTDNPADGAGLTLEPNDTPPDGMRMVEKLTVKCAEIAGVHYAHVGKKKAGAMLDGREHREFPR